MLLRHSQLPAGTPLQTLVEAVQQFYREGTALLIDASVQWTLLDAHPDEAFIASDEMR